MTPPPDGATPTPSSPKKVQLRSRGVGHSNNDNTPPYHRPPTPNSDPHGTFRNRSILRPPSPRRTLDDDADAAAGLTAHAQRRPTPLSHSSRSFSQPIIVAPRLEGSRSASSASPQAERRQFASRSFDATQLPPAAGLGRCSLGMAYNSEHDFLLLSAASSARDVAPVGSPGDYPRAGSSSFPPYGLPNVEGSPPGSFPPYGLPSIKGSPSAASQHRRRIEGVSLPAPSLFTNHDNTAPNRARYVVLGWDLSSRPRRAQFLISATATFGFTLLYGYLQELLAVELCHRKLGLFLALMQFMG